MNKLKLQLTLFILLPLTLFIKLTPYRMQMAFGNQLGRILKSQNTKSYQTTLKNLQLCFPTLSKSERDTLLKKNYSSLGMAFMEGFMSWWLPQKKITNLLTIHGKEHIEETLKTHGIILISPHFHTLELVGRLLSNELNIAVMYRPQKIKMLDRVVAHYRKKHYLNLIARNDLRTMITLLKNKKIVWYAPDSDHGIKNSVFAPFFGIQTATVTGTSRIAKMGNAKVIPCFFYRREHTKGYDIYFESPLENFPSSDIYQDTVRINQLLEKAILKAPEQYLWQYKRFKTRPAGEKRFY